MKITPRDVLENYVHSGGLEEDYKNILLVEDNPVWLDSFYALLDINNFTKKQLLESNSLLSKIMLIEKANKLDELREYLRSIVIKINKEERLGLTSKEKKEELEGYIVQVVSKKIGINETEKLIQELKKDQL